MRIALRREEIDLAPLLSAKIVLSLIDLVVLS